MIFFVLSNPICILFCLLCFLFIQFYTFIPPFFPFHFPLLKCIPLLISLTFPPYVLFVEITGFPSCSETCVSIKFLSSSQIHFSVICYNEIKMPPINKLFLFFSPELHSIFHYQCFVLPFLSNLLSIGPPPPAISSSVWLGESSPCNPSHGRTLCNTNLVSPSGCTDFSVAALSPNY